MAGIPDDKFWEDFDQRMYQFYKALRTNQKKSVQDARAVTEQEFGEKANWCEVQYQEELQRGKS